MIDFPQPLWYYQESSTILRILCATQSLPYFFSLRPPLPVLLLAAAAILHSTSIFQTVLYTSLVIGFIMALPLTKAALVASLSSHADAVAMLA